jgi:hypothetical protein
MDKGRGGSPGFAVVSYAHGLLLANRTTVVANLGANRYELIFLDSTGGRIAVAGRRGSGPGEFMSINDVFDVEGSVGIADVRQRRLSVFSPGGEHVRDVRFIAESGPIFAIIGWVLGVGPVTSTGAPGAARQYQFRDATGAVIRTMEGPPALPVFDSAPTNCMPQNLAVVVGDVLFAVEQKTGAIWAYRGDGTTERIYRSPRDPRVDREASEAIGKAYARRGFAPETVAAVLTRYGSEGSRAPMVWDAVLPDATGRLWLEVSHCGPPPTGWAPEWDVVDTRGSLVGTFSLSAARALRAVRGQWTSVMTFDSLEVQYVNLVRLRPNEQR